MEEETFENTTIYGDGGCEEKLESDEISSEEEGFMAGYNSSYAEESASEEE